MKSQKQIDHLVFRTEKLNEQNKVMEDEIQELTHKI